jgi:xylose isomerase
MEQFTDIPTIAYKGPESADPLSFRYYNPDEVINGKTMEEHMRFSIVAWHSVCGEGADPFGPGCIEYPWKNEDAGTQQKRKIWALMELGSKLQMPYFAWHGRDLAIEDPDLGQYEKNLHTAAAIIKSANETYGRKLAWGTENLFSHPRYAEGAFTSPYPDVVARAAAEVVNMMAVTADLGGTGYVFWGGREGYDALQNTDMALELDNVGTMYNLLIDHLQKNHPGIEAWEEPKAKEPKMFQYARDVATTLAFIRKYGLVGKLKCNIEGNHTNLAGLTLAHDLRVARINDALGSIDANDGDLLTGWDVDEYQHDYKATVAAWAEVDLNGGLHQGYLNFDAKPRRTSTTIRDKVIGHIVGIDSWAYAMRMVEKRKADGVVDGMVAERYSGYNSGIGADIKAGTVTLDALKAHAAANPVDTIPSGRIEEYWFQENRLLSQGL